MSRSIYKHKPKFNFNISPYLAMPEANPNTVSFSTAALAPVPNLIMRNIFSWKTSLKMNQKMAGLYKCINTNPFSPCNGMMAFVIGFI